MNAAATLARDAAVVADANAKGANADAARNAVTTAAKKDVTKGAATNAAAVGSRKPPNDAELALTRQSFQRKPSSEGGFLVRKVFWCGKYVL